MHAIPPHPLWRRLERLARYCAVLGIMAAHLLLYAVEYHDGAWLALAELARFIPYYWFLAVFFTALLLCMGLARWLLVATLCNILLFVTLGMGLQWNRVPPEDAPGTRVRVLTYNIKAQQARYRADGFADIDREVRLHDADIVALQDANGWLPDISQHKPTPSPPIFGLPYVVGLGQYVLASRYPLQACNAGQLGHTGEPHPYLRCQVLVDGKTVNLVTAHFVSPRHALVEVRTGLLNGLPHWSANLAQRLAQSQALRKDLATLAPPLIVMGDFNAREGSPVVENLKRVGLQDSFAQAGRGWGYTHGHALNRRLDLLRIDHVLTSAGIVALSSTVGNSDASEHNPVITDLLIQR